MVPFNRKYFPYLPNFSSRNCHSYAIFRHIFGEAKILMHVSISLFSIDFCPPEQ